MSGATTRMALAGTVVLAVLALTGCYWTPESNPAGISLRIDSRTVDSTSVGASAVDEGFYLAYVMGEDFLRGDPESGQQAFAELGEVFSDALAELLTGGSVDDFSVDINYPSVSVQAAFFTGTSGTTSFGGLRPGSDYLVVVSAAGGSGDSGLGFTTARVEAGDTTTVDLSLNSSSTDLQQFLQEDYGVIAADSTGTVVVNRSDGISELYADLVPGSSPAPEPLTPTISNWYEAISLRDTTGSVIAKSGTRDPVLSSDTNTATIDGINAGVSFRLILVNEMDRNNPPGTVYISEPFTLNAGETLELDHRDTDGGIDFEVFSVEPSED